MLIVYVLLFLIGYRSINTYYVLYHSDMDQTSYRTFDCLYAHLIDSDRMIDKHHILNSHLIPYCRRPDDDENQEEVFNARDKNIASIINFTDLKKQGITSEQLLTWFVPIDIVEKYEMNRIGSEIFYNCSSPWFGSLCQYKFYHNFSIPFGKVIRAIFREQLNEIYEQINGTCYRFLPNCNNYSWPMCLDWRQVCDGVMDCSNGEDEQSCDQLEMTQCDTNQYRCHYGGQCIALAFQGDYERTTDCLDGSDELENIHSMNTYCWYEPIFNCEERIARYPGTFQCGDGEYLIDIGIFNDQTSCGNKKDKKLARLMLTTMGHIPDIDCQKAFYCALQLGKIFNEGKVGFFEKSSNYLFLIEDDSNEECQPLSKYCLSKLLVIPARPILFDFFQFIYLTNRSADQFEDNIAPDFVCFNMARCPILAANIVPIEMISGLTCCHLSNLTKTTIIPDFDAATEIFSSIRQMCLGLGNETSCTNSSYFHCNESMKCIPNHRVQDGKADCFFAEDELFDTCQWNDSNRFQCPSKLNKCLSPVASGNLVIDCPSGEDEVPVSMRNSAMPVPFQQICDSIDIYTSNGFQGTETDETNCHWWPCSNPYTRCDGSLHCLDISDELNCPNTVCNFNEYQCLDIKDKRPYCLSRSDLYDKYLDPCYQNRTFNRHIYFYNETSDISNSYFPWKNARCLTFDKFCLNGHNFPTLPSQNDICSLPIKLDRLVYSSIIKHVENNADFCSILQSTHTYENIYLTAKRFGYYPSLLTNVSSFQTNQTEHDLPVYINNKLMLFCIRGVAIVDHRNQPKLCLCPPNYFGVRCQWQSQRISLTLQFLWRSTASSSVIFQAIIMLIDENGHIAPNHEQIMYLPVRDCATKYNLYLLYPHRPKSLLHNYSIRIDFYEKSQLLYWTSWHLSILFPFLPVNRIAVQLFVPGLPDTQPCVLSCGKHGKCMRYSNTNLSFFCQCNHGYSGADCNITHTCNCANDSICLSSSICICPPSKFGSYCYLKHPICQLSTNPCQHSGLCMPYDDRISLKRFSCLCPEEYSGEQCQNQNTRIDIQLNEIPMLETSLLLIHFITAYDNIEHERTTLMKKVPFDQQNLIVYAPQPFNILFIQIPNRDYYLAVLRETRLLTERISTEIPLAHRCLSIAELLNITILQYDYLRRVKYYPRLCRQYSQLRCFHDDVSMCICDLDRFSNCFSFNHIVNSDCQENNQCENGGQCFQNNDQCPTKLTCICPDCYYGGKCQFLTSNLMFSLDPILGYHIKPHISMHRQPLIIQISAFIIIMMVIISSINGCLSIIVFRRKKPRLVGTGNYLFISSITSVILMILLTFKFWELFLSQKSTITNRIFLQWNCILLDFILKVLLATSEWLQACVATERMMSVLRSTAFNQKKSKEISKWVILSVMILTIVTHIHDPIHRQLIDDFDIDERRIWCLVQYSSAVNTYNSFITFFHFLVPFLINLFSGFYLIQLLARNRAGVQRNQTFQEHFKHQLDQHRYILIAPCLLILLSLPRLIISFISGCMRSARQPWFHLISYFLSFIPSLLTFIVFVVPSKSYRAEFHLGMQEIRKRFREEVFSRG